MLIIFESPDKTGKTTIAKMLADELNIPYLKLNNINVVEDTEIKDGISISTHSQLETVTQLYEKGVIKDAILDRFHLSEYAYTRLFQRTYDISYIEDIDERLSKYNDVILIRLRPSFVEMKRRFSKEGILQEGQIGALNVYYNMAYDYTKLPTIEIDSDGSPEKTFALLVAQLHLRGISKDKPKNKRWTHTETMMYLANGLAKRSPCITRQVGCILTEDGFIVGAGYNGPPSGLKHDEFDIRKEKGFKSGEGLDYSRDVHAEQNAMQQSGIRTQRAGNLELFTTASPCIHCMRQLIQIGVNRIVYNEKYDHPLAWEMAKEAGIEMVQYEE